MRILSVDPGYERLGVAVLEGPCGSETLLYSDCFQTPKENGHPDRLLEIGVRFEKLIRNEHPDVLALETLFFNANQKTALKVAEVRGLLIYLAKKTGLAVHEYSPQEVKVAVTGKGNSDKRQVAEMVEKLIKIDKTVKFDDEYDAIAVGLTCIAQERF